MAWTTLQEHVELRLEHVTLTGTVEYDPSQNALTIMCPDTDESEVLTVDLTQYGYVAFPGEVFVKDWSEHSGLAGAIQAAGIATVVEQITVGPFESTAYRIRLNQADEPPLG